MLGRRAVLVALVAMLSALPSAMAGAQMVPACPRGSGVLAPATVGPLVMREGNGLGAVNLGSSAADVERAWGQPGECLPLPRGYSYHYRLSDDGGQTGLVVVAVMQQDRVEFVLAVLEPHSGGRGPALRTGRGVAILAPAEDVRRTYGDPTLETQNGVGYVSEGVAFRISRGVVEGILIFRAGTIPPGWRP